MRGYLLLLCTACFGVGFGFNYGTSNQVLYLLDAARRFYPVNWQRDWVASTHPYHPAYTELGTLLLWLDGSGWMIALFNCLSVIVGMACVYWVVRQLTSAAIALPCALLVLILALANRTLSVGGSYVFADIFQPSTLGSIGLLGAAGAFVAGRPLLSGLCLAFCGAFHANYMLLALVVFGVAWLLDKSKPRGHCLLLGLGPALLVLAWLLPVLLAMGGPGADEAFLIHQDIRAPHHFRIEYFARDFLPWFGFQLAGTAALLGRIRQGHAPERRLLQLFVGFWVLVIPAALLSSTMLVRAVNQLFAWRLCPHSDLLAQAALSAAMLRLIVEPSQSADNLPRSERIGFALGATALLLGVVLGARPLAPVLTLILMALAFSARYWREAFAQRVQRPGLLGEALLLVVFAAIIFTPLRRLSAKSNLLSGDPALEKLCGWLATNTPVTALLLTPPQEEEIRFQCRRSIVVDWKSIPPAPAEVFEWRRRLEAEIGRPLHGFSDLVGYEELDAARLAKLRARYGFDVVVTHSGKGWRLGAQPAFAYGRFEAYLLPPLDAAAAPGAAGSQ